MPTTGGFQANEGWEFVFSVFRAMKTPSPADLTAGVISAQVHPTETGALLLGFRNNFLTLSTWILSRNMTQDILSKLNVAFQSQDFKVSGEVDNWNAPESKGKKPDTKQ